ncbi:MAG: sigma-70 family RNA polymerase sigma factor [Patescibacteria group bacterium]|jgi:RNA polymerase primary sigma factor
MNADNNKEPGVSESLGLTGAENEPLSAYYATIRGYKRLSFEEEQELACRIRTTLDADAFNLLVVSNLYLVPYVVRRFRSRRGTLSDFDLIQVGNMGLMMAARKFDEQQKFRFSTYARWWIRNLILREIAEHSRTVRVALHAQSFLRILTATYYQLLHKHPDREPTPQEIADWLEMPKEEVERALNRRGEAHMISLDQPISSSGDESSSWHGLIGDSFSQSPDWRLVGEAELISLCDEVRDFQLKTRVLREPRRTFFCLRYGLDGEFQRRTLQEVADLRGCTREWVRQTTKVAWQQLRERGVIEDEDWLRGLLKKIKNLRTVLTEAR